MKKIIKCWSCKGKGTEEKMTYGFFGRHIIDVSCHICTGIGSYEVDEYICKRCGRVYRLFGHEMFTGQCESCYADVDTGKYIDEFFYVTQTTLPELSKKVGLLLKEGYMPVGRPFRLNPYGISQAVIKKEVTNV